MPITAQDISTPHISAAPGDVLATAANELVQHLAPLAGTGNTAVTVAAGDRPSEGFEVTVSPERVHIAGDSPRGALNGAYWLLEQLGFLWVRPGVGGTRFVPGKALPEGVHRSSPAFPRRTLILGNDALHDDWRDWMLFASRNRLNSVFFHDTPPSLLSRDGAVRPSDADGIARDGKGWLFERWDTDGAAIREEALRHGIALQFGGHHLPALLKRALFAEHPDWFPLRGGVRDSLFNLCPTSPGALAEVRARARDFFQRFAGAGVYHLWADDILHGGWCECPTCPGLTPSDQALRATNVLAEALAEVDSSAVVAHLAYHDTIAPPVTERPLPNVTGLYAPRNRNYAFAIDDPACPRNADDHYAELEGLARTFQGNSGPLSVFEYYSDAILYKWLAPPNLAMLPRDAAAYRRAGVGDFGDLAVTPRPWCGPNWHAWWFARCAWDPAADAAAEVERFTAAAFGSDGPVFGQLLWEFDEAYRLFLDLGDLERIPKHDVLDFSDTPRSSLSLKSEQLRAATSRMNAAVCSLPLMPAGLGRDFREELAVQLAAANHLSERVQAWDAALSARATDAREHLGLAKLHFNALVDWDRTHTPAPYANLSRGMLRAASWHTQQIANMVAAD